MAAPLSDAAIQTQIAIWLGDTPDGQVAGLIRGLWDRYPQYGGWRRGLAAAGDALTQLVGALRRELRDPTITKERIDAVRLELETLREQRAAITAALTQLLSEGPNTRVSVGQLRTQAPIASPANQPDANDSRFRGDPNRPAWAQGWPW
jgi:hypothetical protein